jgi:hypothetical protein
MDLLDHLRTRFASPALLRELDKLQAFEEQFHRQLWQAYRRSAGLLLLLAGAVLFLWQGPWDFVRCFATAFTGVILCLLTWAQLRFPSASDVDALRHRMQHWHDCLFPSLTQRLQREPQAVISSPDGGHRLVPAASVVQLAHVAYSDSSNAMTLPPWLLEHLTALAACPPAELDAPSLRALQETFGPKGPSEPQLPTGE